MARGKYKSAAEARRVREEAISEAEAGRRAIVKLSAENKDLRETLAAEREANTARLRELNAMLAEGAAPEVTALRGELSRSREETSSARHHIAKQVSTLMHRNDFRATFSFYAECAKLLGLTVQDLMPRTAEVNRNSRRATTKNLRLLEASDIQFSPAGLADVFEGFEAGENAGRRSFS